jgi:phosphoenolpyruvate-protein phosphotransferase (PTS system enzyme I)
VIYPLGQGASQGPSKLAVPIEFLAAVSSEFAAETAVKARAMGIGLLRTEFMFADYPEEPTHATQVASYRRIANLFPQLPVAIRTWDCGPDKPLRFLAGRSVRRGIRAYPMLTDILDRQLSAIAQAAQGSSALVGVMAPMVSLPEELEWFVQRCRDHGLSRIGTMLETPALAVMIDDVVKLVDFICVGTNDLASGAFGASRDSPFDSSYFDLWQPATLRVINMIAKCCQVNSTPLSVCVSSFTDTLIFAVLAGIGVEATAVPAAQLIRIWDSFTEVSTEQCVEAAVAALSQPTAKAARSAAYLAFSANQ